MKANINNVNNVKVIYGEENLKEIFNELIENKFIEILEEVENKF